MILSLYFFCAFVSVALVKFANHGDEQFILVGTVKDLVLNPRVSSGGFLHVYKIIEEGEKLELLHKTPVEDIPGAIVPFQVQTVISFKKRPNKP